MKKVPNIVFLIIAIIGLTGAGIMFAMFSSEQEMSFNSLKEIAELEKNVSSLMNKNSDLMMQLSGVEDQKKKLESKIAEEKNSLGILDVNLSYPTGEIPDDLLVCAERVSGGSPICRSEKIKNDKYKNGQGIKLELPEGVFRVFTIKLGGQKRGYYTEQSACEMRGEDIEECGNKIIEVEVKPQETIDNILVSDFEYEGHEEANS